MARHVSSPVMVGRAAELAALLGALDEVERGGPAALLIAGEAGAGKSRLLAELAAVARARGVLVALGGCVELREGGIPASGEFASELGARYPTSEPRTVSLRGISAPIPVVTIDWRDVGG